MALFVVVAIDRPGRLERRLSTREKHLSYLVELGESIKSAGPFTTEDGVPCGSMLIIEAETIEEVENTLSKDPYVASGLFESVTIRPWKHIVGSGIHYKKLS